MGFLVLGVLVLLALSATIVHRHQQSVAWSRELDQAFGVAGSRELPRHRAL